MRLSTAAALMSLLLAIPSTADVTLLVDFGPFKKADGKNSGSRKKADSSISDFALADPRVAPDTWIHNLALNLGEIDAGDREPGLKGHNIVADLIYDTEVAGYGAFKGDYADTPILDTYLVTFKKTASITVDNLEEIPAGATVTLALWGGGDKAGQDTTFSIVYDGVESPPQTFVHGVPQPEAFKRFTFTKVNGANQVTIRYGNPKGHGGFGGFSLTSKAAFVEPQ